jgi:3-oxoacyl-[acyl-carrier-protein] synthase II
MAGMNRVVVTGLGAIAANGIGAEAFWETLLAGRSGVGPITLFDASGLKTRIAGEVKGFDAREHIDEAHRPKRMGRFTQLSVAAAAMALRDARLTSRDMKRAGRVAVVIGVSTSDTDVIEKQVLRISEKGHASASPFTAITSLPQAAAGAIGAMLPTETEILTVSTGCPAGLDAIAWAASGIRAGRTDLAVVGGADAPITMLTMATFCASDSMSTRNDDPEHASRPFDLHRDGGLMAEGAGIVVLENLECALARGAPVYLEINGYGVNGDADLTAPASGLSRAMQQAVANSGCRLTDIDYICAHGPSDPLLDQVETEAIKEVFEDRAYQVPVSSIKAVTGNPLAAAGPLQVVTCALALRDGAVPPTANYETPDPECDLDYVAGTPRMITFRHALINNHGYGGSNSSLVVGKPPLNGHSP